ncbi:tyrosine-protein phosphatase non-receptor type 2a isoform X2 [Misgurnus anguillicaudatus]|uniref:tyrosine-protein phosphatase non-receptor type 2a isoform X2 n=1 Tax=Misgurnus anguillicaudatus TaxID=75329 RepID=UPI0024354D02|nr:tyrosine-protein phosphatase non-receptor type 2a isoform X2 [Misgurnus anguillicaudatus]
MDLEFENIDSSGQWQNLYNEIRHQSQECPYKVAKFPENRNRNRYRDVSPYDHSRVRLENSENDYINASLITVEEAQRSQTTNQNNLTPDELHHGFNMPNQPKMSLEKCAQYWPSKEEQDMDFSDAGFVVILVSEDIEPNYTIRVLELQNSKTGETREIYHFHYTTWPDFGVPESPASFLNFLFNVRESGSLGPENGPAVVHCSAGIGRSGTFSLVDTCLVLMDIRKDPFSVDIQKVLLDMREYRMGLIQTADQLRFSYMAVMEGTKRILGDSALQQKLCQDPQESNADLGSSYQSPIMSSDKLNGKSDSCTELQDPGRGERIQSPKEEQHTGLKTESLHRRKREERIANTSQKLQQMKLKLNDSEKKRENWLFWKPILFNVGAGAGIALVVCMCWAFLS